MGELKDKKYEYDSPTVYYKPISYFFYLYSLLRITFNRFNFKAPMPYHAEVSLNRITAIFFMDKWEATQSEYDSPWRPL
jgi:hypothetical protein